MKCIYSKCVIVLNGTISTKNLKNRNALQKETLPPCKGKTPQLEPNSNLDL